MNALSIAENMFNNVCVGVCLSVSGDTSFTAVRADRKNNSSVCVCKSGSNKIEKVGF